MSAKMMFGLTKPILLKESKQGAVHLFGAMFETCLERLEILALIYDKVAGNLARIKEGKFANFLDAAIIEKAQPVGGAVYATKNPEEIIYGEPLSAPKNASN
jgi:transformation/transcription domain-associated protein